jgi:putative DNA primase/helicase
VVENVTQNVVITHDTMERAIKLGTALIGHARAAFDLMERDPEVDHALKVLEWIRRKRLKTFTARDCFCDLQNRFGRVEVLRPVLALLVERDYLRALPKITGPEGGRPSEPYAVNPQALEGGV